MPADFLDTSALAKHYHAALGSGVSGGSWERSSHP